MVCLCSLEKWDFLTPARTAEQPESPHTSSVAAVAATAMENTGCFYCALPQDVLISLKAPLRRAAIERLVPPTARYSCSPEMTHYSPYTRVEGTREVRTFAAFIGLPMPISAIIYDYCVEIKPSSFLEWQGYMHLENKEYDQLVENLLLLDRTTGFNTENARLLKHLFENLYNSLSNNTFTDGHGDRVRAILDFFIKCTYDESIRLALENFISKEAAVSQSLVHGKDRAPTLRAAASIELFRYRRNMIQKMYKGGVWETAHLFQIEHRLGKLGFGIPQPGSLFPTLLIEENISQMVCQFINKYDPVRYLLTQCQSPTGDAPEFRKAILAWATGHYGLHHFDTFDELTVALCEDPAELGAIGLRGATLTLPGALLLLEDAGVLQREGL